MGNIFKNIIHVILNYLYDFWVFVTYSGVFNNNSEEKFLGKLNYFYHSIEKGLINTPIRLGFGKKKINTLLYYIHYWINNDFNVMHSQFIAACSVLLKYYKYHKEMNYDVSDIISEKDLLLIEKYSNDEVGGTISLESERYFGNKLSSFQIFSDSRHSIRHFTGEKINIQIIEKVVKIARNAPSVCNRQSVEVYLINNKNLSKSILDIQSGMNASSENVEQILILTSEIGSFVSPVERNQMFVDGGIFLQNILYSLHFNGIAACALNWSKPFFYEYNVRKHLKISHKKRIICAIAIGYPEKNIKVPFSSRKEVDEILHVINS